MWIKNWNRLCSSQGRQCKTCPRCLVSFNPHKDMEAHLRRCSGFAVGRCELPPPGQTIKFKPTAQQALHPIVIYADFECVQNPKHAAVSFQLTVVAPGTPVHQTTILRVCPDLTASEAFFEELHKLESAS